MNESNQTVGKVTPGKGRAGTWWTVRPVLRAILLVEFVAGVGLFMADSMSAAMVRAWFRSMVPTLEEIQPVLNFFAVVAVIAALVEAFRTGRIALRRSLRGGQVLKTA